MSKLDNIDLMKTLDKSKMHHLVTHLPEQIYFGYFESSVDLNNSDQSNEYENCGEVKGENLFGKHKFSNIIISGMGGSAISADIIKVLFSSFIPINIVKDYNFSTPSPGSLHKNGEKSPHINGVEQGEGVVDKIVNNKTLYIIISYSGNTEEAIECCKQALNETSNVIVITSGGKLKDIIEDFQSKSENNISYFDTFRMPSLIIVPSGLPPRAAIGYLFFAILRVLEKLNIVPDHSKEVKHLIPNLMKKAGPLCWATETKFNLAKSSAEVIFPKIPIIYSSSPFLAPVAYRWKCQFNENGKMPAFSNSIPELCHNEIEAYENENYSKNIIPIFLRTFSDKDVYQRLVNSFQSLLRKKNINYLEFYGDNHIQGADKISLLDIFTLIYLGDIISFYLGILNGVDPYTINNINYIKSKNFDEN
ncbi:MAG: bifunctional phosphoglucose/phosphomannose isomerase [Candidatus Cloacimonetes bacterium]|nr:bifunctional phosphoglucose/phosphomannose isomerase [Candidatus Cloacimonadota bacterium]